MKRRAIPWGCAIAACAVTACSSTGERPDAELARAEASISAAEQAGARQYGAADLETARSKLTRAQMLAEDGADADAQRLAEQAIVDAEVAGARGETGRSREALRQVQAGIESLRDEVNRPGDALPGEEAP